MIKEYDIREDLYQDIPHGGIGCEIGVCRGYNAVQLFHAAKPSKMYLVDIWDNQIIHGEYGMRYNPVRPGDYQNRVEKLFEHEIESGIIKVVKQYSFDFLINLEDNYLDWVYLDSSHEYHNTKKEIDLCLNKIKPNGLLMGHDFTSGTPFLTGVMRPILESAQKQKIEIIGLTTERFCSFMAKVK